MKCQVLFSLENNEKVFMNVVSAVVIGTLRVKANYAAGSILIHKKEKRKSCLWKRVKPAVVER